MTTVPNNKPDVVFWLHSDITEMEPDVQYAAAILRRPTRPDCDISLFNRPVQVSLNALGMLTVADPDMPVDVVKIVSDPSYGIVIIGRWAELRGDWFAHETWTWQQYAAHQYGQVLRHNSLVDRLVDFGIPRTHEAYLPQNRKGNFVERSLTLNYDELDRLLRAAGF